MSRRIIVAANRLPVTRVGETWERSPGGLVSALTPILQKSNGVWIGWSGAADQALDPFHHDGIDHVAVPLSAEEVENHYVGFSNETVWPLFHDAIRTPTYHRHWWKTYKEVNRRFAEAIAEAADDDDLVWVHDYQLLLVSGVLKEIAPRLDVRFFLHIPFPPVEIYARLPWRTQIIEALLAADVIGFQTPRSAHNFTGSATAFADATDSSGGLILGDHIAKVVATPISVDTEDFAGIAASDLTKKRVSEIRQELGDPEIVLLGADRLDYTKGINNRLRSFETLLEQHPRLAGTAKFIQIGVPSREAIGDYAAIREEIEQIAGRINSMHGSRHYMPVHYVYESLSREDLVAYYRAADVMVVTPLADGMNLVAKEFVSSRIDDRGVLLLSEFAGAAQELRDALLVNPYDVDGMARQMLRAIEMEPEEGRRRMRAMRKIVAANDVHHWASSSLGSDLDVVTA